MSEYLIEGLEDVPVIRVSSTKDALRRFAASFYNHPSRKMLMVGVTGTCPPSLQNQTLFRISEIF